MTRVSLRWWNISQTFAHDSQSSQWPLPHQLVEPPLLWDTDCETLVVTGDVDVSSAIFDTGLLPPNVQQFKVPDLSSDWLSSELGKHIVSRPDAANQVLMLEPAVWTSEAARIAMELRTAFKEVIPEVSTPCGRVFYWNSRVGMRDFFLETPSVAKHVIRSVVCHDITQVAALLKRCTKPVVIKSHFAMGGAGTTLFDPANPKEIETLIGDSWSSSKTKSSPIYNWRHEPYVVEEFVGNQTSNESITVDGRVNSSGRVDLIGISRQRLSGFAYRGIANLPITDFSLLLEKFHAVGTGLASKGFCGYFNVDWCLLSNDQFYICDLNIRRSAPLHLHMLLRRIEEKWGKPEQYWFDVSFPTTCRSDSEVIVRLKAAGLLFDGRRGALPISTPHKHGDSNAVSIGIFESRSQSIDKFISEVRYACQH
jgi:hypothetical protein